MVHRRQQILKAIPRLACGCSRVARELHGRLVDPLVPEPRHEPWLWGVEKGQTESIGD